MVAFEGRLYVFGGWDGAAYVAGAYEYDPSRDAWTERTPMPTARGFAGAVVAGGRIYVVGGTNDGAAGLAVNEEYAPSREGTGAAWASRAAMPEGRWGMGVASLADIAYVSGGAGSETPLAPIKYLPLRDVWEPFDEAPVAQWSRLVVVPLDTRLLAVGGRTETALASEPYAYQAIYTIAFPIAP